MRNVMIILLSLSGSPIFSQNTSCHVMYNFENTSIEDAIKRWEDWCKMNIVYNGEDVKSIKLTGKHGLISLRDALNFALENTDLGWDETDDKSIVIKPKDKIAKHIIISNKFEGTPLKKVLTIWEWNYKLDINYSKDDVEGIEVYGNIKDEPLERALNKILHNTPLDFTISDKLEIEIFKSPDKEKETKVYTNVSEDVTLSGIVKDALTGETLPYATIYVLNSTQGTTTNLDGKFTLFNVPTDTSTIEISYIGYASKKLKLNPDLDKLAIHIVLTSNDLVIDEITISAVKKDQMLSASKGISRIGISPAALSKLPSYGEKDIFRSLQLLPGISGSNESSSGLYIRGGTPDQNLVLFDGFTVYHVDHLFGFFSAFNSSAVKDVQLHKGGFDAKYGGRLSSVVELTGKDGNTKAFNMGFGLSLLSANGFIESPFADGKGSFIIAGRRSFASGFYNNIFGAYTESNEAASTETIQTTGRGGRVASQEIQPNTYFYDLNAKTTYRPSSKDILSLSIYNGQDNLDNSHNVDESAFRNRGGVTPNFTFDQENTDLTEWGNWGASMKWSRQWNERLYTNTNLSYSNYFSERDQSDETIISRTDTTIARSSSTFEQNDLRDVSFKMDSELKISQANQLDFGIQSTYNNIDYSFTQNDTMTIVDRKDEGFTSALYLQDRHTFSNKLIVKGGLRSSYYSLTDKLYFEPRTSLTYLLTEKLKVKAAWGRYYQFANRIVREDVQQGSRDFWLLADGERVPVSSSVHHIAGLSYETSDWLFDVEAYYKKLYGLSEYSTRFVPIGFGRDQEIGFEEFFHTGSGIAKGIEFLVQRKLGDFTGWAGYTLGEVQYNFDAFGEESFFANHDVTHELKLVGNYQLGKVNFGATFIYATGKPYTAPTGYYEIQLLDGTSNDFFEISDKNTVRFEPYHRLDLSATYDFNIGESKASTGISLTNIYNRKNTWYNEYEVIEGELLETNVSLLGFTPSLFFAWTLR